MKPADGPAALTRSQVNAAIAEALACLARFGIALPAFAFGTPAEWDRQGPDTAEIRDCMLGWAHNTVGAQT
jgi:D-lyxose ketol-isomerase